MNEGETTPESSSPNSVLLYDGTCPFCTATARFIDNRARGDRLRIATLQSELGRQLQITHGIDPNQRDTAVLIRGEQVMTHSTAALGAVRLMRLPWSVFSVFLLLPRFCRDAVYHWVANHRSFLSRLFGISATDA